MRVTHLGHSCLFVELAEVRVLIDPGAFSTGFEDLRDLDAVVVTHQHADHLDQGRVAALLAANRQAAVYADPESAQLISGPNTDVVTTVAGQSHRVGAATLAPGGALHAVNHAGVPRCTNVGVVLSADGEPSLYHPGDAYDGEPGDVDILAVPSAPRGRRCRSPSTSYAGWLRRLIPIHDALLSPPGRGMYLDHICRFGGDDLTVHDLAGRGPTPISRG